MTKHNQQSRKHIAIIGGGISGLSAAYRLSPFHEVTLFEAAPRLGGHARTVMAGKNGDQPVDTGFIVFNYATYPHLTKLFAELDVPVTKSAMSFGVTIGDGRLEYGLASLGALFAQKRNLLRPSFYRMIGGILRFGKGAEAAANNDDKTIGQLMDELGLSISFRNDYLLPMCGAIWSTPSDEVHLFPARSLVSFFRNHGLLDVNGQHQWWTVKGGSIEYVRRLEAALVRQGCIIRTGQPVSGITRRADGVTLTTASSGPEHFDEVIFACHSDQALKILGTSATPAEAAALGTIRYQPNRAVLHRDPGQMPKRRKCWSAWVYRSQDGAVGVTYWMNRLQGIAEDDPLFVTLNPRGDIPAADIYDQTEFAHPVFDRAALTAQKSLAAMQGQNRSWYAGAYLRHGFHEDGIDSAMKVVDLIMARSVPLGMPKPTPDNPRTAVAIDV
jgi:predicted NAD/FAD-binding protein